MAHCDLLFLFSCAGAFSTSPLSSHLWPTLKTRQWILNSTSFIVSHSSSTTAKWRIAWDWTDWNTTRSYWRKILDHVLHEDQSRPSLSHLHFFGVKINHQFFNSRYLRSFYRSSCLVCEVYKNQPRWSSFICLISSCFYLSCLPFLLDRSNWLGSNFLNRKVKGRNTASYKKNWMKRCSRYTKSKEGVEQFFFNPR